MNPFDDLPEGPRASAKILVFVIALALLILAVSGLSMLVQPAEAASLEQEAAEICADGCVLMSRADYVTLRAAAGRRCEPEIRL